MENENTDLTARRKPMAAASLLSVYEQKFEAFKTLKSTRSERYRHNNSAAQLIMSQRDPNRMVDSREDTIETSSYVLGDSNGDFSDSEDEQKSGLLLKELPARRGDPVLTGLSGSFQCSALSVRAAEAPETGPADHSEGDTGEYDEDNEDNEDEEDDEERDDDYDDDKEDEDEDDNEEDGEDELESHMDESSPSYVPSGIQPVTEATSGVPNWELNLISPNIPNLVYDDYRKGGELGKESKESAKSVASNSTQATRYTKVAFKSHGEPLAPKSTPLMLQNIAPSPVSYACPFYNTMEYNPNCPTNESLLMTILNHEMDNLDVEPAGVPLKEQFRRFLHRVWHLGDMSAKEYLERYPWERFYDLSGEFTDDSDDKEEFNFSMMPLSANINPFIAKSDSMRNKKPHAFVAKSGDE
ncbi:hypothetical protein KL911_000305 [Ogataea haglerorum]|uniref:uncharacterized protein n=1 Tax=Ogataea haglerorum TaxID=1937702 RepID=UPI001C898DC2|nr:uncharacterized protein KL911_000305 [Ogataea haglerorum]KAG7759168.1 hypothetical protein KL911_000305 [Ogataea haglerorum]